MHNACMTSITVRDVPDETRDELAARAARSGRSLQEYLRASLIDLARRPDVDVLIERVRWHKSATGSTLSAQDILALKDSDRR
jgi:antitoxin FitA